MKLDQLRELVQTCRQNANYHFRDLTPEELVEKSTQSFAKLTEAQRTKVYTSWTNTLKKYGEELNDENIQQLFQFRFLAQTNLYFLCHLLETYNQVTINTHEYICNKFFVQKSPTFSTFEKFAKDYTDKKDRMLLVPRGGFKSSIDMADCVQWTICYPAITILILTGVLKLAKDFLGEVRGHFSLEETTQLDPKTGNFALGPKQLMDKETGEWSESMFQVLFPEHCIEAGEGNAYEFQTPAGGSEKEPTIRAASIEQSLVGMHFGILKLDDVVTNENSQTVDRLAGVNKQISINRAMLHPYGFMDVIGTWYDERDYYGITIKQEEHFHKDEGLGQVIGTVDSGRFESTVTGKIYLRSAWWLTPKAISEGVIETSAKEADYELWFPERLPYSFLENERKTDKPIGSFAIKYLNNPRKIHRVKFPRELLIKRTINHQQLPPQGIVVTTIDTAYSVKSWADYTVIITSLIFGGRFYILNMVRGRFNEYELPQVIAATAFKWKPKRIAVEDSVGVKWMGRELVREMSKLQISIPVEYVSLGLGSKSKSKQIKAKPVLRLLGDERMYFLNSCEGLQEIYNEMEMFTGTGEEPHDDIVCALSLLAEQFGPYADMGAKVDNVNAQHIADAKAHEMHQLVHGLGKYSKYNAANMANNDNPVTTFQMDNGRMFRDDSGSDRDPLADLM